MRIAKVLACAAAAVLTVGVMFAGKRTEATAAAAKLDPGVAIVGAKSYGPGLYVIYGTYAGFSGEPVITVYVTDDPDDEYAGSGTATIWNPTSDTGAGYWAISVTNAGSTADGLLFHANAVNGCEDATTGTDVEVANFVGGVKLNSGDTGGFLWTDVVDAEGGSSGFWLDQSDNWLKTTGYHGGSMFLYMFGPAGAIYQFQVAEPGSESSPFYSSSPSENTLSGTSGTGYGRLSVYMEKWVTTNTWRTSLKVRGRYWDTGNSQWVAGTWQTIDIGDRPY